VRIKINLPVALLTFLLGVTFSNLWYGTTTVERRKLPTANTTADESAVLTVSICDLLNDPTLYQNKRFKLEGVLYSTDTALLVYENCSNIRGQVPVIAVGFEDISDDLSRLLDALDGVRRPGKMEVDVRVIGDALDGVRRPGKMEVDVRVIGEMDGWYTVDDDPYLHIVVKRFEVLSPLRRFRLRRAG
jgi:hypothetical protein